MYIIIYLFYTFSIDMSNLFYVLTFDKVQFLDKQFDETRIRNKTKIKKFI